MNKKQIIWSVIILVIIVLLVLITTTIRGENPGAREEINQESENRAELTINAKHQYKDGEHAFVGVLELPSPCHSFNAGIVDAKNEDSMPEIELSINDPAEGEVCIQVVTERTWKVTYPSDDPELEFSASLNGEAVNLNLFEVPADQDIDTVELFIKG